MTSQIETDYHDMIESVEMTAEMNKELDGVLNAIGDSMEMTAEMNKELDDVLNAIDDSIEMTAEMNKALDDVLKSIDNSVENMTSREKIEIGLILAKMTGATALGYTLKDNRNLLNSAI